MRERPRSAEKGRGIANGAWQIGVDVGGTFTDLLALDPERGVFRVAKVPSTPEDQSVGFIAGLRIAVVGAPS